MLDYTDANLTNTGKLNVTELRTLSQDHISKSLNNKTLMQKLRNRKAQIALKGDNSMLNTSLQEHKLHSSSTARIENQADEI